MGTVTRTIQGPSSKTPFQQKKEERDKRIREEWRQLMAEKPGRSRMMVKDYLKEKYGICSDDAYYKILKGDRP